MTPGEKLARSSRIWARATAGSGATGVVCPFAWGDEAASNTAASMASRVNAGGAEAAGGCSGFGVSAGDPQAVSATKAKGRATEATRRDFDMKAPKVSGPDERP